MTAAQRQQLLGTPYPEAQPVRIVYSATVTQSGSGQAGDGFRTHRATVNAQPKGSS
jgi:hypothetical protein